MEMIKKCEDLLLKLYHNVNLYNSLNFYDINVSSEYFFADLLNAIFDLNLKNANDVKNNAAAIDLYDEPNRIAVQVTSDGSSAKIRNSLDVFFKNKNDLKYDRLLFVVIVDSKKYTADFTKNLKNNFTFDKDDDIVTIEVLLKEIRKLSLKKIQKVLELLEFHLDTALDTIHISSPQDLFDEISQNTNGYINESYFEIDDKRFKERFIQEYNDSSIIKVRAFSKEEGTFCILNLIRNTFPTTPVLVVKDLESWKKCREYVSGGVVVPDFSSDEIPAMPNAKTIFINAEYDDLDKEIPMPKRTIRFLSDKLRSNGCQDTSFVEKSKGLFYYIKKKLYQGKKENPGWFKSKEKSTMVAVIIGMWAETDTDKKVIEKMYGGSYEDFISYLRTYMGGECPLVVKYRNSIFELADVSVAWAFCKENLSQDSAKEYIDKLSEIICSDVSFALKTGAARSLIFFSIYFDCENYINQTVEKILVNDSSRQNITQSYLSVLCEAAPEVFCEFLNSVITEYEKTNTNGREHYIVIINDLISLGILDKLLMYECSAPQCVKTLLKIYSLNISSSINSKIHDILIQVFWTCNTVALKADQKIQLANHYYVLYDFVWDIIHEDIFKSSLTYGIDRVYGRHYDGFDYTNEEISRLIKCYSEILTSGKCFSVDRAIKMIKLSENLPDDLYHKTIAEVCRFADGLCDKDKETIKRKIRNEIFHHEKYPDCSWSMPKSRINELKKVCDSISFENQAYDFLYLSQTNDPIYRPPVEYLGISDEIQEQDKKIDSILKMEFVRFKSLKISLEKFLNLIEKDNSSQIGKCIGRYYSNGKFNEEVLRQILNSDCSNTIVIDYILECEGDNTDIKKQALDFVKENGRDDLIPLILLRMPFNSETIEILEKEPEAIVADFWAKSGSAFNLQKDDQLCYLISNQIKYKNFYNALLNLWHNLTKIKSDEIISLLNEITTSIHRSNHILCSSEKWFFDKILPWLEEESSGNLALYSRMAEIEIRLVGIVDFSALKVVQKLLATTPTFFANIAYFASNETPSSFYLYYEITRHWNFCPGYCNGSIQKNIYNNWIKVFTELLKRQGKGELISRLLGYLFAHSPVGDDGHFPHEFIRETIENIGDETLLDCYYCDVFNRRGVVHMTNGDSDFALAEKYRKEADFLKCIYPKTAKIFERLSNTYENSGKEIRNDAENMML